MSPCDHVYIYGGSYENIDFHVKHIAKTKASIENKSTQMNIHSNC